MLPESIGEPNQLIQNHTTYMAAHNRMNNNNYIRSQTPVTKNKKKPSKRTVVRRRYLYVLPEGDAAERRQQRLGFRSFGVHLVFN